MAKRRIDAIFLPAIEDVYKSKILETKPPIKLKLRLSEHLTINEAQGYT
jgi:hypothetical protein